MLATALTVAVVACDSNENKPTEKPPVVTEPSATPAPTATPAAPEVPEYCKPEGKRFACGQPPKPTGLTAKNAVWIGLPACGPDTDGDNIGEGPAFFKELAELEAQSKKSGIAITVKMLDGSLVHFGSGFAAPCQEF